MTKGQGSNLLGEKCFSRLATTGYNSFILDLLLLKYELLSCLKP